MKKDKFCDHLLYNIYDLVEDTDYAITPLSVRTDNGVILKEKDATKTFPTWKVWNPSFTTTVNKCTQLSLL